VIDSAKLQPVIEPADLGAGAFVHRDDARCGGGLQRRAPGLGQLLGGQQVAGGGPDQMVRIAGQRPLNAEAGCHREFRNHPSQRRRGQRGVDVDAGQIGGPVTEHRVEVGCARWSVVGPRRLVPAVPPDRPALVGGGMVGDHLNALCARGGRP
jgi:hypothetical protein